jgi:hypothetical protein
MTSYSVMRYTSGLYSLFPFIMSRTSLPTFLAAVMLTVLVAGCTTDTTDSAATGGSSSSMPLADSGMASSDHTDQYTDGTYDATGNYTSPAGAEEMDVTLILADDVVTDATFTGKATNPVSKVRQQAFADGFKELVVGKSIDAIALTKVNGSSLVPKGFMDAVAKIKLEAQAS